MVVAGFVTYCCIKSHCLPTEREAIEIIAYTYGLYGAAELLHQAWTRSSPDGMAWHLIVGGVAVALVCVRASAGIIRGLLERGSADRPLLPAGPAPNPAASGVPASVVAAAPAASGDPAPAAAAAAGAAVSAPAGEAAAGVASQPTADTVTKGRWVRISLVAVLILALLAVAFPVLQRLRGRSGTVPLPEHIARPRQ